MNSQNYQPNDSERPENLGIGSYLAKAAHAREGTTKIPMGVLKPKPAHPLFHKENTEFSAVSTSSNSASSNLPQPTISLPTRSQSSLGGYTSNSAPSSLPAYSKNTYLNRKTSGSEPYVPVHSKIYSASKRQTSIPTYRQQQGIGGVNANKNGRNDTASKDRSEIIDYQKERITQLSNEIRELKTSAKELQYSKQQSVDIISDLKEAVTKLQHESDILKTNHNHEMELAQHKMDAQKREEMESLKSQYKQKFEEALKETQADFESREAQLHQKFNDTTTSLKTDLEEERAKHAAEVSNLIENYSFKLETKKNDLEKRHNAEIKRLQAENSHIAEEHKTVRQHERDLEAELAITKAQLNSTTNERDRYKNIKENYEIQQGNLQNNISQYESSVEGLKQQLAIRDAEVHELRSRLINEEALRRKLHNKLQDMKGNIRVYCRPRPLVGPKEHDRIEMAFPDRDSEGQKLQIVSEHQDTFTAAKTTRTQQFEFDKVFTPQTTNKDVFLEISELVQSALDGYNVCIFAYGQTGSGKTYTMQSPGDGMIPLTIDQIFRTAEKMKKTGWSYKFSGEFLEIYNEHINDLLAGTALETTRAYLPTGKLHIKHFPETQKTIVEGLTQVALDSPVQVHELLRQASKNRSTAATNANDRSSRSHSVFVLRLEGHNAITGEKREGVLNLIDLAGSERLSSSQTTGDRLKETQAINKSLSSLVDVITALGNSGTLPTFGGYNAVTATPGGHTANNFVPFRNSKLTHLLQYSLSGSSKTLMLVNVSSFKQHESETINSLRFATKVNHTKLRR